MNIVQLKASIEIVFWNLAISLLTKSRVAQDFFCRIYSLINHARHALPARGSMIVAGCILLFGLLSGRFVGGQTLSQVPVAALSAISPAPTPSNGQVNLLVIGLDRLSSQRPRLMSVWILGYFSGQPQVSLIPIYPSSSPLQNRELQKVGSNFSLTSGAQLDQDLVRLLQKKRIWWNGYLLIDEIAMIDVINFLGGVTPDGQPLTGGQAVAALSEENTSSALENQTRLLQALCRRTELLTPAADLRDMLNLIPDHIQTDLDVFQAIREWRDLVNGSQSIKCEFPLQNPALP